MLELLTAAEHSVGRLLKRQAPKASVAPGKVSYLNGERRGVWYADQHVRVNGRWCYVTASQNGDPGACGTCIAESRQSCLGS